MIQARFMYWLRFLLVLSLLAAVLPANALQAVPALNNTVTDLTNTLSVQEQAALSNKLQQFFEAKGSQVAVLIVPTTQPEAIEQYSIRVVDEWKLGREKEDDGVLVLIAKQDRKMRIEVGYGLEGAIPDLVAKRIISRTLAPHFKRGQFYQGVNKATDQLMQLIEGENLPEFDRRAQRPMAFGDILPLVIIGGMIFGGILRAVFGNVMGGIVNGGIIGFLVYLFGAGLFAALIFGFIGFIIGMAGGNGALGGRHYGGYGGYGGSSGGFGGGGFGGLGGGFGGGGASGDW